VVECIDSFKRAGELFLVFEFAPGVTLQAAINATERGLPKDHVKQYCWEICKAVQVGLRTPFSLSPVAAPATLPRPCHDLSCARSSW